MNQFCIIQSECSDQSAPTANYSAETPDARIFIARNYGTQQDPPLGSVWYASSCVGRAMSTISQADADAKAQRANIECLRREWPNLEPNPNPDPDQPPDIPVLRETFTNSEQSCDYECADGTSYTYVVPEGMFAAFNQATADSFAHSYACNMAISTHICLGDLSLTSGCANEEFSASASISAGQRIVSVAIIGGSLPDGLTLSADTTSFTISGTPTETGSFPFVVQATDVTGGFNQKEFTIITASISNASLADGEIGIPYSATMTVSGYVNGTIHWTVASGSLPDGLSLNITTGEITGTPTTVQTSTFTIQFEDGFE